MCQNSDSDGNSSPLTNEAPNPGQSTSGGAEAFSPPDGPIHPATAADVAEDFFHPNGFAYGSGLYGGDPNLPRLSTADPRHHPAAGDQLVASNRDSAQLLDRTDGHPYNKIDADDDLRDPVDPPELSEEAKLILHTLSGLMEDLKRAMRASDELRKQVMEVQGGRITPSQQNLQTQNIEGIEHAFHQLETFTESIAVTGPAQQARQQHAQHRAYISGYNRGALEDRINEAGWRGWENYRLSVGHHEQNARHNDPNQQDIPIQLARAAVTDTRAAAASARAPHQETMDSALGAAQGLLQDARGRIRPAATESPQRQRKRRI